MISKHEYLTGTGDQWKHFYSYLTQPNQANSKNEPTDKKALGASVVIHTYQFGKWPSILINIIWLFSISL